MCTNHEFKFRHNIVFKCPFLTTIENCFEPWISHFDARAHQMINQEYDKLNNGVRQFQVEHMSLLYYGYE